jgi:hypothetical protein
MTSIKIWEQVARFHRRNLTSLLFIFPILFVPVATDALHTILIDREKKQIDSSSPNAVLQAVRIMPELLVVKLYFWVVALIWSFVPIYGWMKEIDYRIAWGMASNVVILEKKRRTVAIQRCMELARTVDKKLSIRALLTMPALLITLSVILVAIPQGFIDFYWAWMVFLLWIAFPAAAAANTYCYFTVQRVTQSA